MLRADVFAPSTCLPSCGNSALMLLRRNHASLTLPARGLNSWAHHCRWPAWLRELSPSQSKPMRCWDSWERNVPFTSAGAEVLWARSCKQPSCHQARPACGCSQPGGGRLRAVRERPGLRGIVCSFWNLLGLQLCTPVRFSFSLKPGREGFPSPKTETILTGPGQTATLVQSTVAGVASCCHL